MSMFDFTIDFKDGDPVRIPCHNDKAHHLADVESPNSEELHFPGFRRSIIFSLVFVASD